ncbi:MAG TPA: 3'-5' exonuclease, partial [Bacillota bacterium]|nr:3'-5' exonuclease [Bacillota bacterium]
YNVIKNNMGRKEKKLWSEKSKGQQIKLYKADNERDEAEFICSEITSHIASGASYQDIAILYRMNAQSRVLEESLMKYSLPYNIYGGLRFYDRMEIKDIISYLRVMDNPSDDVSLQRIINVPRRGIGDTSLEKLKNVAQERQDHLFNVIVKFDEDILGRTASKVKEFAQILLRLIDKKDKLSLTDLLQELLEESNYLGSLEKENSIEASSRIDNIKEFVSAAKEFEEGNPQAGLTEFLESIALIADIDRLETHDDSDNGSVSLMTMHSAKGLEFPTVFVTGLEEGLFPHSRSMESDEELEEERRLCYVGITRAKNLLYISHAVRRTLYGNAIFNTPSRFIREIPRDLIEDLSRDSLDRTVNISKPSSRHQDLLLGRKPKPIEKTKAKQRGRFNLGDKVHHTQFGDGTIVSINGRDSDLILKVAFIQGGIKSFLGSLAPLKKI